MFHQLLQKKTAQISFVAGVLFFIIASQPVFKFVEDLLKKTLNVTLRGNSLLLVHSVLFAVLVGIVTSYIFFPLFGGTFLEGQRRNTRFELTRDDFEGEDGEALYAEYLQAMENSRKASKLKQLKKK